MSVQPTPIRYSSLIPQTARDFCRASVPVVRYQPVCAGGDSPVTVMETPSDFLSLRPEEAKSFLANLVRHASADCKAQITPFVRADVVRGLTGRLDLIPVVQSQAYHELGGLDQAFAGDLENGDVDPNSSWIVDQISVPERGTLELGLRMLDAGQRAIHCAIDEQTGLGMLTVTEGDLSLAFSVSPQEVALAGLAFYSGSKGLADYIGLSASKYRAKKKPIAAWMSQGLEKLKDEVFQGNRDIEFTPVDWSRESDGFPTQARDGVIVSGAILAKGFESGQSMLEQVVLRMSLVASGATQVFDEEEDGKRRVEMLKGRPEPRVFVEILRPRTLIDAKTLPVVGGLKNWIEKIWSGQYSV